MLFFVCRMDAHWHTLSGAILSARRSSSSTACPTRGRWIRLQPGRTLLDWPHDVAQLVEALRLERFGLQGVSGGAPHALACAGPCPTGSGPWPS
jgi:pimeloyl-ACP methyl ester carboxylesterase